VSGSIAIVGASLAGLRAAEFLRRDGFQGRLLLIGDETQPPYDRPPLSKEVLRGDWEADRIALRRKSYDELCLDLRLGTRAVGLDSSKRVLSLDSGDELAFDQLVIATGASVRRLPKQPDMDGIFSLRTLGDALAIRDAMKASPRVAVIGAGFIGAEVAASARQLGLQVDMIEALEVPLAQSLGPELGRALASAHEKRGVRVHCGRKVVGFQGRDRLQGLLLDDGTELPCELVVVGIGVQPAVDWLAGSGLELEDGVRCDATLSSNVQGIVAIGDVANWYNPLFDEQMRVEHWTNAVEQARHVVQTLCRPEEAKPFESAPMFWSDQYDIKIQGAGRPKPTDELRIMGRLDDEAFVGLYSREDRLVGAVSFNNPAKLIQLRRKIVNRASLSEAVELFET
jgi:3-phenylpropionate/trans-cinnamate dioxygenase ferredoxin reductase subunit